MILGRGGLKWRHGYRAGLNTSLLPLLRIIERDVDDEPAFKKSIERFIDRHEEGLRQATRRNKTRNHGLKSQNPEGECKNSMALLLKGDAATY